jgi:hypothetical protein
MSTVALASLAASRSVPPSVSIVLTPPSSKATQRDALPHASTSLPSEFQIRMRASAVPDGSIRIS